MKKAPTKAALERISQDELDYLAVAQQKFNAAKAALDSFVEHIVKKHKLKPADEMDTTTGEITRAPEV